jgi:hypothetical protein
MSNKTKLPLDTVVADFLGELPKTLAEQPISEKKNIIKSDKSLVERMNKTILTEDGRQLLY